MQFAIGQVSSFVTRYRTWQSGIRKRKDAKPPKLNGDTNCYPSLYKGECIKFTADLRSARIKVFTGKDWLWIDVPLSILPGSQRHLVKSNKKLAPALIVNQRRCHLSIPFQCCPQKRQEENVVVSVDLGINTTAVASVVTSDGTVLARKFIHPAYDIDRRDRRLKRISKKASLVRGKLHKGFCRPLYRKAGNINREIGQQVSKQIVELAHKWGVKTIVFEYLKGWRPRGGKKKSNLRQRFHGWLHRRIANLTEEKCSERGGKIFYVSPAYTSKYAYDGSGVVKRGAKNYGICLFPSGKYYNSDLNGSLNIAAKYWLLHKKEKTRTSKRSGRVPRSRAVTLSMLWNASHNSTGCDTAS